jgi:hypothetical protein
MVDPFESLRHDAESTGSTAIDPRFRAELLAEARRRLSSEASTDSIRPRVTADTPTPTQMEPIPMLAKQPKKHRPFLLAAACVALVAVGVVTVAALRADDDRSPAPAQSIPPITNETVPTPTLPEITQPSTTSAPDPDEALAHDLLLTPAEYYPELPIVPNSFTPVGIEWDPVQADGLPSCASYTDSVFRPIAEHDDYRLFHRGTPLGRAKQYVSVLESEEQAASVMNAMAEPHFLQCGIDYAAADAGTNCCNGQKSIPQPLGFASPSAPPFDGIGDQLNYYEWSAPSVDESGVELGQDDPLVGAFVRVGRALVYVEGVLASSDLAPTVTPEGFRGILENVVARATTVVSGREYEPPSVDREIAESMLLSGEEYGPDWTRVPNGWILPTMDSTIAGGIPECAPFWDSVFRAAERGANAFRTFWHRAQPEAFSTQYVAVLPDAAVARSVYERVNSAGFAVCASAYGTVLSGGQSPSSFPSPVDQPITDPPFEPVGDAMTYRTFPHTWHTADGIEVGPQTDLDAVMLVGRTITFIGTTTDAEGGATLNTVDQFRSALERVVERADAALAGNPIT